MKVPTLTPVKSSNIAAIGQHGSDLFIRFQSGQTYRYEGAGHLHADALKAESVGKFFHASISGKYPHRKSDV